MSDFKIEKGRFFLDGREIFLSCAEVHYFRTPRENWEQVLNTVKEAGCNAVAFYTPWLVHEPKEGTFDFEGRLEPENDLQGFLKMVKASGLLAFWRPGPYVYAETTDLGIPQWFLQKNPQSQVMRYEGGEYVPASKIHAVGHNNPDFLLAVEKWYAAIAEVARPYLAPNGPIVMTQLCNEIPCDDHSDENPVNLGLNQKDGLWPSYLREKYGSLEKLNGAYGCSFGDFSKVPPYMLEQADKTLYDMEKREYYYSYYYPRYFENLRAIMERCGISSNFVHNAYNPRAVSLHLQNREKNPWLNVGVDCYYSLNGSLNLNSATYFCEYGAEYLKNVLHAAPWVMEQECGYWNDFPKVYAPELYVFNVWTAAGGYRGFNMYLWNSGKNRPGLGFYGTDHNWQAPVGMDGAKKPAFYAIQKSLKDIAENEEALAAERTYDLVLGVKREPGLIWKPVSRATSETYCALRSLGYSPRLCDFAATSQEDLAKFPCLVIVTDRWMDRETQKKLAAYVENGGRLLLMGCLPTKDEKDRFCHVLADALGVLGGTFPKHPVDQEKLIYEDTEYYLGKTIQNIDVNKGGSVLAYTHAGRPAVVSVKKGKGEALVFPVMWENCFISQATFLGKILSLLGAKATVKGQNFLRAIPKENGQAFIMNLHPVPVKESLVIGEKAFDVELEPYSFKTVSYK